VGRALATAAVIGIAAHLGVAAGGVARADVASRPALVTFGLAQGPADAGLSYTFVWDYADCARSAKSVNNLQVVLTWDNPAQQIAAAPAVASKLAGTCSGTVTGSVPGQTPSGDHTVSAYLADLAGGDSKVRGSDTSAARPFSVTATTPSPTTTAASPIVSATTTATPTASTTSASESQGTIPTPVASSPAVGARSSSQELPVTMAALAVALLCGAGGILLARRRRTARAVTRAGDAAPGSRALHPTAPPWSVHFPPMTGWGTAGFIPSSPWVRGGDVPDLVPLGGDYWRNTPYPLTAAAHVLRAPNASTDPSHVAQIGPFEISARYLSLSFGGQGSTLRILVLPPDGAEADSRQSKIKVGSQHWIDYGLVVSGAGPKLSPVERDLGDFRGGKILLHISAPGSAIVADVHPLLTDLLARRRAPVWGFADLHCHPMAAKGFGGGFIAGDYDSSSRFAADIPPCDHPAAPFQPHYRDVGDVVINNWPDGHQAGPAVGWASGGRDGGPTFRTWPTFLEGIHQQVHPEWIRRAHEGGLRLMVALVVHTEHLADMHAVYPDLPHDDWSVAQRQVQYWNEVCAANSDALAIARSPQEARDIIASGRVAVVLGLEVDSALAAWKHEGDIAAAAGTSFPYASTTESDRAERMQRIRAVIHDQLQRLWDLGIRQINPVHLADNAFGYATVYEEAFNISMEATFGRDFEVAAADDVDYRLGEERDGLSYFLAYAFDGYRPPREQWNSTGVDHDGRKNAGHVNAGPALTGPGRIAVEEMIKQGFIIDIDHMSRNTANQVMDLAEGRATVWSDGRARRPYPVVSAHANFRDLSPGRNWGDESNPGTGQRAYNHIWPHESQKTAAQVARLRQVGGLIAPITSIIDCLQYRRPDGSAPVPNDCPGTSKSWAQEFLYAVDHMQGAAVGLGTDMALLRELGPRFGPLAAYGLTDEQLESAPYERQAHALRQDNGVRYSRVANTLPFFDPPNVFADWTQNPYVYPKDPGGLDLGFGDRCAFATALWDVLSRWSCHDPTPPARGDANEVLRGFRATSEHEASAISPRALLAYQILNGLPVSDRGDENDPRRDFQLISDAVRMWQRMQGTNLPLGRCITGSRHWDFNTDGLAHYGMLPDLLQDLTNVGLPADAMSSLFLSAEAYIRLWERCASWPSLGFSERLAILDTRQIVANLDSPGGGS
jgi:microsomal dipeptidase-like Zn-dependent dipeptidase